MGGANGWTTNITGNDLMRDMQKRILHEERRPQIRTASDLLGPGFGPHAVVTQNWNSAETVFNGTFYSIAGQVINSPDNAAYWIGEVLAQQDGYGVQHVWEHRVAGDPTVLPIREFNRRFYNPGGGGLLVFGPWVQSNLRGVVRSVLTATRTTTVAGGAIFNVLTVTIPAPQVGRVYRAYADTTLANDVAGNYTDLFLKHGSSATTGGTVFAGTTEDHRVASRRTGIHFAGEFTYASGADPYNVVLTATPAANTTTIQAAATFPTTLTVDEIVP